VSGEFGTVLIIRELCEAAEGKEKR